MKQIQPQGLAVTIVQKDDQDYISLTDIAKRKESVEPRYVIQNWLRTRFTIDFIGNWEIIYNKDFNRIEFDAVRQASGDNSFTLSPERWIKTTNAIGLRSSVGRYGGTYAHKDIAFEFASWISPEFKLYLIKEFQRLKDEENERLAIGWDTKRALAKINYRIHTDAIKEHIIPRQITKLQANIVYASEADVLNKSLFGQTAKEWRAAHPRQDGNIRDQASAAQLVCLSNLESLNAEYIRAELPQSERLLKLNHAAISQMKSLVKSTAVKMLGDAMPENLPAADGINKAKTRLKKLNQDEIVGEK